MTPEEARAWLTGQRSTTNMVPDYPRETWIERIARADAAMMEQAYWTLRAMADGLVIHDVADRDAPGGDA